MMGTADALPIEPVMKTTFVEDMTENQLAKAVSVLCHMTYCHAVYSFCPFAVDCNLVSCNFCPVSFTFNLFI